MGRTCLPLISGDVSTWAMKPMTGIRGSLTVAGIVAITYPCSSIAASATPAARSSSTSSRSRSSCVAVLG
jgi:hypothetical protein